MSDHSTAYENESLSWLENLAFEEISMEESGVINFNGHLDPEKELERSSIDFMNLLKEKFELYVNKFNEMRGGNDLTSSQIKIFKISNTVNDFMLFRNSLKLFVSRKNNACIAIGFLDNKMGPFSARTQDDTTVKKITHEIKAHVGAFNEISWRFRNEPISVGSLAKHYLTEFIKYSAS